MYIKKDMEEVSLKSSFLSLSRWVSSIENSYCCSIYQEIKIGRILFIFKEY